MEYACRHGLKDQAKSKGLKYIIQWCSKQGIYLKECLLKIRYKIEVASPVTFLGSIRPRRRQNRRTRSHWYW
jgi:hypothetical protein